MGSNKTSLLLVMTILMLCKSVMLNVREWSLSMTGVGAEDFFQNKKKISSLKAKMCGRFQTPTLIMAINFIPQLRYPRANCHHINSTAHKKRAVGLPLTSKASSDVNVCQGQLQDNCQICALSLHKI